MKTREEQDVKDKMEDKLQPSTSGNCKTPPRRKGRGRNSNGNDTRGKLSSRGRHNDPNWYFLSKEVADQASSISMSQYMDVPFTLHHKANWEGDVEFRVPTVLVLELNPSPGDTSQITSGINMAGLQTYAALSSVNAKTTQYAPQDVTTLTLALGEVISILEHIRRAFGVAFTYNQRNRAMPHKLLTALGFRADDFLQDLAQHRMQFNSWITALNKIPFLDNIAYLHKCADLYQNVYLDSESDMAQIVVMKPYSTWVIDETLSDQGTVLKTVGQFRDITWSEIVELVSMQIEKLFESATFNYIYSDILNYSTKAGAKLLYMDYLLEGYAVVPQYNRNFMLQVHNAIVVGVPLAKDDTPTGFTKSNDVYPDVNKNKLTYNPLFPSPTPHELILDFDTPTASVEDRIEATRFQGITKFYDGTVSTGIRNRTVSLPDHYVANMRIDSSNGDFAQVGTAISISSSTTSLPLTQIRTMCGLTKIDWAPLQYVLMEKGLEGFVNGDLNYFTTVDQDWYQRVNDLTFQSLFTLR